MTTKEKVNALAAVVCIAAISLIASAIYRRRRRRRIQRAAARRSCSPVEGKPQHRFKRVLADNSYSPFKHLKREDIEQETPSKVHPYEEEITVLLEQPPTLTNFVTSCECLDMGGSYAWVDTKQKLESLVQLLSKEQVFAVDTEQHSLRSFLGFTALMQISTQKEDFLIDTIALHDVMAILRPIFSDPSICKVFHGSSNDVLWLQRDFHIYIVNMFDTAKACQVLSKPYKSLAYLLETYCRVSTDKTLQLEDWRLRPLSAEMIHYARTDAHYLLYIADQLASELRKETLASLDDKFSFLSEASRLSNMVCLQLYAKEIESSPGASAAASIYSRKSDLQEVISLRSSETEVVIWKLCAWRDIMARIHDESVRFVLSDNAIVALAAKFPKNPSEVHDAIGQADLTNASPSTNPSFPSPSPVVSSHLNELCHLLHKVNGNLDDFFVRSLQKHLQPTGCCPLSIYNYALLSGFSLKQTGYLFSKKQSGGKPTATVGRKSSRELFVQKFSCKSPVYHNCRIYASDGRLLCYCDRRKLDWYLRRDLAKLVEKDPPGIMLLFEPKGRPEDEDNDFYIQSKKNICVGCGEKDHYLRYRIIPSCYRMHFPEHLKSHRSHDIVLLCVDCHEVAHTSAEKYKRQIAEEFGIPLFVQKILDSGESEAVTVTLESVDGVEETGVSPLQLRSAAMALLRHGSDMPLKRHDELMQIVRTYFGGRETSREDLEVALLVGMSPHEKRRLQKKRGITFKYLKASVDRRIATSIIVEKTEDEKLDNAKPQEASEDEIVNGVGVEATNTSTNGLYLDLLPEGETSTLSEDQHFDVRETLERTSVCNGHGNQDIVENAIGSCQVSRSHQVSSKTNKKISLLGHGLHGKQVVEHLLQTCEEDGIHQFCQRWRQVFVEATHPRYLPSGWDIMHSGRREFGEYSVYNPAKKAVSDEQHI